MLAACCIALSLLVFLLFTFPANQQTQNLALSALTLSLLVGRDPSA